MKDAALMHSSSLDLMRSSPLKKQTISGSYPLRITSGPANSISNFFMPFAVPSHVDLIEPALRTFAPEPISATQETGAFSVPIKSEEAHSTRRSFSATNWESHFEPSWISNW